MKHFYLVVLLISSVSYCMKKSPTSQLDELTEPLLSTSDRYKLTESDYAFINSDFVQITPPPEDDGPVLHTIERTSENNKSKFFIPGGTAWIRSTTWSLLELPEAQKDPLSYLQSNPHLGAIRGKLTLSCLSHDITEYPFEVYTDFEITDATLDRSSTFLTIQGKRSTKYKLLIYQLMFGKGLERIIFKSNSRKFAHVLLSPNKSKIFIIFKSAKSNSIAKANVYTLPDCKKIISIPKEIFHGEDPAMITWRNDDSLFMMNKKNEFYEYCVN